MKALKAAAGGKKPIKFAGAPEDDKDKTSGGGFGNLVQKVAEARQAMDELKDKVADKVDEARKPKKKDAGAGEDQAADASWWGGGSGGDAFAHQFGDDAQEFMVDGRSKTDPDFVLGGDDSADEWSDAEEASPAAHHPKRGATTGDRGKVAAGGGKVGRSKGGAIPTPRVADPWADEDEEFSASVAGSPVPTIVTDPLAAPAEDHASRDAASSVAAQVQATTDHATAEPGASNEASPLNDGAAKPVAQQKQRRRKHKRIGDSKPVAADPWADSDGEKPEPKADPPVAIDMPEAPSSKEMVEPLETTVTKEDDVRNKRDKKGRSKTKVKKKKEKNTAPADDGAEAGGEEVW